MPLNRVDVGCRAETFFGMWLMPFDRLDTLLNVGWAVVESGEIKVYAERSQAMQENQPDKGYTVSNGIAHLSLSGPLTKFSTSFSSLFGGTAMSEVQRALAAARVDPEVKKIWIDVDSWGGTAEGTAELAAAIRKTNEVKPVAGHAEDKATSGALWLASQFGKFTAGPTASVGSQGTILKMMDTSEQAKKEGRKPVIISTSEIKEIGVEGKPISEKDKQEMHRYVAAVNEPFKQEVAKGRNLTTGQLAEVATARMFVGEDAVRVGLIDKVCTRDEALEAFRNEPDGAAGRVPAPPVKTTDASTRSSAMAFNAKQLEQIRQLPGAPAITEQNAEQEVTDFVTKLSGQVTAAQTTVSQKDTLIGELRQQIPTKLDPAMKQGHVRLAAKEIAHLEKTGKCLPEQKKVLDGILLDAQGQPKADVNVAADGTVFVPLTAVTNVLEINKPSGLTSDVTGAQPQARTEPGSDEGDQAAKPTLAQYNATRAQYGLPPVESLPAAN